MNAKFLFTATAFLSSFLLFFVEPLLGKMLLGLFGGSAAVWITCLAFFQVILVGGYAYANWLSKLPVRRQAMIHVGLLLVAAVFLPLRLAEWANAAPPPLGVILVLTATIGPVFFVMSSHSPLLQQWWARWPGTADAYRLSIWSNLGCMAALIGFPLAAEPWMATSLMRYFWSGAFIALAGLVAYVGFKTPDNSLADVSPAPADGAPYAAAWADRRAWLLLSALPSGLLTALTLYLCTQVAPIPLFWTVTLGLYLLSLVMAFSNFGQALSGILAGGTPAVATFWAATVYFQFLPEMWRIVVHVLSFFWVISAAHVIVVGRRPPVTGLTTFFLDFSIGGAIGGLIASIAAPALFNGLYEFPLFLILTVLAVRRYAGPDRWWPEHDRGLHLAFAIGSVALIYEVLTDCAWAMGPAAAASVAIVAAASRRRDVILGSLAAAALLIVLESNQAKTVLKAGRSFYGAYRIDEVPSGQARYLYHGNTVHGMQWTRPEEMIMLATSYYSEEGPVGNVFDYLRSKASPLKVGVVGLGTGTMATYARTGDDWTYFEIDAENIELIQSGKYFTYVQKAAVPIRMVEGDARTTLERESDESVDVLFLDAFTSDAVPVHLLTQEAFRMYLKKLRPDGLLVVHISNRYLDFEPVLRAVATAENLSIAIRSHGPSRHAARRGADGSSWGVLTRSPEAIDGIAKTSPRWKKTSTKPLQRVWTDDYSSMATIWHAF